MPFSRQPPGRKLSIDGVVNGNGRGAKQYRSVLGLQARMTGDVKANLHTARVKAASPITGLIAREIVPFDTQPVLTVTAVQAIPASAQAFPDPRLGKVTRGSCMERHFAYDGGPNGRLAGARGCVITSSHSLYYAGFPTVCQQITR